MNHVVAAAAGLVLDQPSFFSTLLKKLILPPSVSMFKFLLSDPYTLDFDWQEINVYHFLSFVYTKIPAPIVGFYLIGNTTLVLVHTEDFPVGYNSQASYAVCQEAL